jgi:hypothetical protein
MLAAVNAKCLHVRCRMERNGNYGDLLGQDNGAIYQEPFWIGLNIRACGKCWIKNETEFLAVSRYGNRDIGERRVER